MRTAIFIALLFLSAAVLAQRTQGGAQATGFPDAPGRDVLVSKCFQCHGPGMFMAHRQDRRAWESTLYRMVGRGALWTESEIKAMADYLGKVYGKDERK
jgi:cytochrome c5